MNQVAIREDVSFEVILKDVEVMQKMCAQLMKTKHYQTMGEAGLFAIMQKAKSLNINALEALNGGLYYVNGKVGMSSEMMACLIRQAGHSITKDPKSDEKVCVLHGKRSDNGDTWMVSFSMEDAKRAGLAKNMYEKYPGIMLYNRCMSMLARQLFPDVIKGAGYTMEELNEIKERTPLGASEEITIVEPVKSYISEEQANALMITLEQCPKDYIKNVTDWVMRNRGGFDKLEMADYEALIERAQKKAQENTNEAHAA